MMTVQRLERIRLAHSFHVEANGAPTPDTVEGQREELLVEVDRLRKENVEYASTFLGMAGKLAELATALQGKGG